MSYLHRLIVLFVTGAFPVLGCSETSANGGAGATGGAAGSGGAGGSGGGTGDVFPCSEQGIRDAIVRGGGPHYFDCDGTAPVVTQAEIKIDNDVILDGEERLTVDGGGVHRVFEVVNRSVELRGITVSGGQGPTGRIFFGAGGILQNGGVVTLIDCTVSGNVNPGVNPFGVNQPGNIFTRDGELVLINSTVSNNTGGGIGTSLSAILRVTNSTVSGNVGHPGNMEPRWASGIVATQATIRNSTISGDTALYGESAGPSAPIDIVLTGTLIAGECQVANEARLTSNGHNVESPGDTCGFDRDTDRILNQTQLNLGPLADNGGPTKTHKPGAGDFGDGSDAIDWIPADACLDADGMPLASDQRGLPRPVAILGPEPKCDVGSVEVQEGNQ